MINFVLSKIGRDINLKTHLGLSVVVLVVVAVVLDSGRGQI